MLAWREESSWRRSFFRSRIRWKGSKASRHQGLGTRRARRVPSPWCLVPLASSDLRRRGFRVARERVARGAGVAEHLGDGRAAGEGPLDRLLRRLVVVLV